MEEKRLFSFWTVYSLCMKTKCMQISGTNAHGAAVCSLCDCVRGVMCILYTTKPSEQHEHGFEFTSQFGWNSRRLAEQYSLRLPVGPARQPR